MKMRTNPESYSSRSTCRQVRDVLEKYGKETMCDGTRQTDKETQREMRTTSNASAEVPLAATKHEKFGLSCHTFLKFIG